MQNRRTFIKNSCAACIGMSAFGILLESCVTSQNVTKSTLKNNQIEVPISNFQTNNYTIIRNKNLPYDILLVKQNEEYKALQMRCTHNEVALSFTGKKLICSAHGSEFDTNGNVTKEPAQKSLSTYQTSLENQNIIIHLK